LTSTFSGSHARKAQSLIEKRLSDGGFVKNPHVNVIRERVHVQGANVLVKSRNRACIPCWEPRLVDSSPQAGGFTEPGRSQITLKPPQPGRQTRNRSLRRNLPTIRPANHGFSGDTILVHKADVVYVVGDVGRRWISHGLENLTVLKVLALAGARTGTAN